MRVTRMLQSGDDRPWGKYDKYLGSWGHLSDIKQKGVTTYAMSANRQRPLAGTLNAAIFNSARRFSAQVLYVVPPFLVAYSLVHWAIERNEYLNSKQGRAEFGEEA